MASGYVNGPPYIVAASLIFFFSVKFVAVEIIDDLWLSAIMHACMPGSLDGAPMRIDKERRSTAAKIDSYLLATVWTRWTSPMMGGVCNGVQYNAFSHSRDVVVA